MRVSLADAEAAIRAAWGPDTAYATAEYQQRNPGCPARGQCGPTALVVQDLLGGELLVAPLSVAGVVDGVHYWNSINGRWVDLTREQLLADERLGTATVAPRLALPRPERARAAYLLLRARVFAALRVADV